MSTPKTKNKKGSSLAFLKSNEPPGFRESTDGRSCKTCVNFYLKLGWKGVGDCTLYSHITDESLMCDSYTSDEE